MQLYYKYKLILPINNVTLCYKSLIKGIIFHTKILVSVNMFYLGLTEWTLKSFTPILYIRTVVCVSVVVFCV